LMVVRKIVEIDESRCDGCGRCIPDCPEGALRIVDGKARLVGEARCDGLGACLGRCPRDAMRVVEREEIFRLNDVREVTVVNMEVPCCGGLGWIVEKAVEASGRDLSVGRRIVTVGGDLL
jgi:NAD-dependent dihydropyrimidine dehydrogenase PreA subunit